MISLFFWHDINWWGNAFLIFQVSEVSIRLYSLVHWEDPLDMTQGCSPTLGVSFSTKEGTLQYRSGTTYLGKELWKSCYLVLRYGQHRQQGQKLGSVCYSCIHWVVFKKPIQCFSGLINLTNTYSPSSFKNVIHVFFPLNTICSYQIFFMIDFVFIMLLAIPLCILSVLTICTIFMSHLLLNLFQKNPTIWLCGRYRMTQIP